MLGDVREFFTLSETERAARATDPDEPSARQLSRLLVQRARAAEALAEAHQRAEAERMADDALSLTRQLSERFRSIAELLDRRAKTAAEEASRLGPSEALFDEQHADDQTLDEKLAALRAVSRALDGVAMGAAARRDARWQRIGVVLCAMLFGALVWVRQSRIVKLTPRASAFYGPQYDPKYAVDDTISSNWLLPDATPGWLDLTFDRRVIRAIELTNVQNLSHYGTHDVTVELYSGNRMVRSIDVSLRATVGTTNVTRVNVPVRDNLERIRIHIRTWHSFGGGLGEVRVQ